LGLAGKVDEARAHTPIPNPFPARGKGLYWRDSPPRR
jgi:hypothetical protein